MSRASKNGRGTLSAMMPIPLPQGFEASWAGPLPAGRIFCLGSEDGKLLFTKEDGVIVHGPAKVSPSGSAINGVTISGFWLAASTREEVSFLPLRVGERGDCAGLAFPHGAHGVATTFSGYFIAPMGRTGIMAVAPPLALGGSITVFGDEKEDYYSYRVACLRAADATEILVVAARKRGLGFIPFRGPEHQHVVSTASLEGLDVVDFCQPAPWTDPTAVLALGRDGRLVLFRNILNDTKPATFKFESLAGTGYRVLSSLGDVYVLTSKGVFVLAGLVSQLMSRAAGDKVDAKILALNVEAVDANLCGDEWMLVVTPEGVQRFDVRALHESGMEDVSTTRVQESQSVNDADDWKWSGFAQNSVQLALAS